VEVKYCLAIPLPGSIMAVGPLLNPKRVDTMSEDIKEVEGTSSKPKAKPIARSLFLQLWAEVDQMENGTLEHLHNLCSAYSSASLESVRARAYSLRSQLKKEFPHLDIPEVPKKAKKSKQSLLREFQSAFGS
tara:strand:+ start:119 stop:514 length:396 start_codon:yes stop_codon:yes gene_type:complete